ncbi:MAG: PAS domain S-box protein [Nitrospirota bacterium]
MSDFFRAIFLSDTFLPHGQCLLWQPALLWLHAVSDTLITLAYYSIPMTLGYFVYKRRDVAFPWMFLLFGVFIFLCGTTHLVGVWTLWRPVYWLDGIVKLTTAGVSVATAILLVPLIPKAVALPSPAQLAAANRELRREIDDRTRAEEALRGSEEKFRAATAAANDAIISADSRGNVIYLNPCGERMFGYAMDEVRGAPLTILMPERFREAHQRGLQRYLATGDSRVIGRTVELIGQKRNGAEFPVELSLATWKTSEGTFFTAIIRDITERKCAEEQMGRLNARLEAMNKELEAFSYSVSHDLRAPLRHIHGFVDLLAGHVRERLDATGQRYINTIRDSAVRMGRLIDDLLTFSRMAKAEMRIGPVRLDPLIQEAVADLQDEMAGRDIAWTIGPLPEVDADPSMLRQVWVNLLSNAVKYTRQRARAEIEIGSASEEEEQVFFIRDNGIGFDPRYAGKLFGVFQRLHRPDEFEGTGIGLANVRRIIERHGGRVWAEGRVNGGAVFYFSLPKRG